MLAADNAQDPSPCQTATINRDGALVTEETFESCNEVVGTIDEDKDGICPELDSGGESETGGGETGVDDGGVVGLPDLGFGGP